MASPEQEAFITEMLSKKPGEIWLELWEARQILGLKGVGTVSDNRRLPEDVESGEPFCPPIYGDREVKFSKVKLSQEDLDDLDDIIAPDITPMAAILKGYVRIPNAFLEKQPLEYMVDDLGNVSFRVSMGE